MKREQQSTGQRHWRLRTPVGLRAAVWVLATALAIGPSASEAAVGTEEGLPDLLDLSIEELMEVEISSVVKRPQRLIEAPAAAYVLTAREIESSGATTLPDLLRLVPGLMVAQAGSQSWAVTARGFNGTTANKLQLLMDGRSLYTPLFSGVFWEVQNVPLDIIERIEVIRGPGAALWGANAVNGVINIITKSAADTQGGVAELGAGTEERAQAYVRNGFGSDRVAYRVWARYFNRDSSELASGGERVDAWDMMQAGFRADSLAADGPNWMVQGGIYEGQTDTEAMLSFPEPPFSETRLTETALSGAHLLARWARPGAAGGEFRLQGYVESTERMTPDFFGEERLTAEVDMQHRMRPGSRHRLIWGASYRVSSDSVANSFTIAWNPAESTLDLFSAFIQDEMPWAEGKGDLILGVKLEHNEFTGLEVQPNVRALYRVSERRTFWAALSRAVRTPSRLDHDAQLNFAISAGPPPIFFALVGNEGFDAESVVALEFGYRDQLSETLSFDLALFHNVYENLLSAEDAEAPEFADGIIVLPLVLSNKLGGESHGLELAIGWRPSERFDLRSGFTFFDMNLRLDPDSTDTFSEASERADPAAQAFLHGIFRPADRFELTSSLRFVDSLRQTGVSDYLELDLRAAWGLSERVRLTVSGRNLLQDSHLEFGGAASGLVERSLRGAIRWQF